MNIRLTIKEFTISCVLRGHYIFTQALLKDELMNTAILEGARKNGNKMLLLLREFETAAAHACQIEAPNC